MQNIRTLSVFFALTILGFYNASFAGSSAIKDYVETHGGCSLLYDAGWFKEKWKIGSAPFGVPYLKWKQSDFDALSQEADRCAPEMNTAFMVEQLKGRIKSRMEKHERDVEREAQLRRLREERDRKKQAKEIIRSKTRKDFEEMKASFEGISNDDTGLEKLKEMAIRLKVMSHIITENGLSSTPLDNEIWRFETKVLDKTDAIMKQTSNKSSKGFFGSLFGFFLGD